jgi:hypothetical protein
MKLANPGPVTALAMASAIAMLTATLAGAAGISGTSPPPSALPTPPTGTDAGKRNATGSTAQPVPTATPLLPPAGKAPPSVSPNQPGPGATTSSPGAPIQLSPANVKRLSKPKPVPATFEDVEAAFSEAKHAATEYKQHVGYADTQSKSCSTRAYSAQDQKAAGCQGSNTVEQCMEKLYDYCMSKCCPGKESFGKTTSQLSAASQKLAQRAQSYANHVQQMLDLYYGK